MVVDSHVHFRDFNQREKETIKHGLEVARDSGVDGVFDMPNTNPPIMTRDLVIERLKLADEAGVPEVFYGLYIGLNREVGQVKRAIDIYREFFPRVVGFKLYAGHSVGNLGVIDNISQFYIYQTLAREGYDGVIAVHCEKEDLMDSKLFDKNKPITHCLARPPIAEVESIRNQIEFVKTTGFKGKLHIAHISLPESVFEVYQAKISGVNISCGVCPHHLFFNQEMMLKENGLLLKMNPPLREINAPASMLESLKRGTIDWIETDHAPHTLTDKLDDCASGIPNLPKWPLFLHLLKLNGFSERQIYSVTHRVIIERFGIDIPTHNTYKKDHSQDYDFDVWKDLENQIGWRNLR